MVAVALTRGERGSHLRQRREGACQSSLAKRQGEAARRAPWRALRKQCRGLGSVPERAGDAPHRRPLQPCPPGTGASDAQTGAAKPANGVLRAEGRPVGTGMTSRIESQPDTVYLHQQPTTRRVSLCPLPSAHAYLWRRGRVKRDSPCQRLVPVDGMAQGDPSSRAAVTHAARTLPSTKRRGRCTPAWPPPYSSLHAMATTHVRKDNACQFPRQAHGV
jgi:hypothetical protein